MSSDTLVEASEGLAEAGRATGGPIGERLVDLAEQMRGLAGRDRPPDHGRLARLQQHLREVAEGADDPAAVEAADRANELVNAFRETIEGV